MDWKIYEFYIEKNIIFIDSMLFLNSSLDKLVKTLKNFKYLSNAFKENKLELVKKKGIYRYKYMDRWNY